MRIAFLTNELLAGNPQKMWRGVIDAVRAYGANSVCLVGGYLNNNPHDSTPANLLYENVRSQNIDGIVIRGHLCSGVDHDTEMAFYRQFRDFPCVIIGRKVPGIPHLIMDSYSGMRDAIIHLIETHNCRYIAFVRGPELYDAQERYRAYIDVLREYEIPFDPDLVTPALRDWDHETNINIQQLFNHRPKLDAIVTASDELAQHAINELKEHYIRIPEDVAVVGFDNVGSVIMPRLTSVDSMFYEQGKQGAEMLFDLLDGFEVPDHVLLPTRLQIRQSCGCLDLQTVHTTVSLHSHSVKSIVTESHNYPTDLNSKVEILSQSAHEQWHIDLLNDLNIQVKSPNSDYFLRVLDRNLRESAFNVNELERWRNRISFLREQILTCTDTIKDVRWAEDLFQQAQVLVNHAMLWEQSKRRKDAQERTNLLYEISQALVATFDTKKIMKVLVHELPRLDIPSAYISLYEETSDKMQLLMAYNDKEWNQPPQSFPTWQLLAEELLPTDRLYSMVVELLHFQNEVIGVAVFEVGSREGSIYDILRGQISGALKSAQLFIQNTRLYEDANQAQKNAEDANRLKSHFLASVSHELRTPLNMLIGFSEMLLPEHHTNRPPLPEQYRQDLERIHIGALHLDDLLRDVLDLAYSQMGRLKLVRKPTDLHEILIAVNALVEPIIHQKNLDWQVKIPDGVIPVWADASRIKQVMLNLIYNAIKFTAEGEITLIVTLGSSEVTISICDTGLGIPLTEQSLIFNEFYSTQRSTIRGYGGMGLGLAICQKLVEMHNGRIGVSSSGNKGSGSTFYFTLPTMSHYLAQKPLSLQDPPRKQAVLLISDYDHPNLQLEDHLMQEGFEIETLQVKANIPGNLPIMFDIPPALIILNIETGSPQSQEFIRLVKSHPDMQDVPILFYSLFHSHDSGSVFMLDHVTKPVDTSTLLRSLARYGLEDEQQTTILIVDDDLNTLDLNINIVQSQLPKCRILEASNGRNALHLIRQHHPDLVLLDLMMPELDGFDVLTAMQSDDTIRHIPAIVLTGMALAEEDMARISRGATAILSKGVFTSDETLAHIKNILARDRGLGSDSQRVVRKVMAYIHQYYTESISRVEMAVYASVSERHLDRCFQQDMGITPINYLNRYRVRQAKTFLIETDMTLSHIAQAVGFSSSSHFSRVFRQEVGSTPSTYRKSV